MTLSATQIEDYLKMSSLADTIAAALLPKVFAGHKGEILTLQIYRNDSPISDAELAGATSLRLHFKNLDGNQNFDVTTNISIVAGGKLQYLTRVGDGVDEAAGTWQYEGFATLAGGIPVKSQAYKRIVFPVIA